MRGEVRKSSTAGVTTILELLQAKERPDSETPRLRLSSAPSRGALRSHAPPEGCVHAEGDGAVPAVARHGQRDFDPGRREVVPHHEAAATDLPLPHPQVLPHGGLGVVPVDEHLCSPGSDAGDRRGPCR